MSDREVMRQALEALGVCATCRPIGYETMTQAREHKVLSAITALRTALEQQAEPVANVGGRDPLEQIIDEYVDSYEMLGDEGDYTPTESERALIKDAVIGLLSDPGWDAAWGAHLKALSQQQAEPCQYCGLSKCDPRCMWVEQTPQQQADPVGEVIDERGELDYISYVPPVGTALYTTPPQQQAEPVAWMDREGDLYKMPEIKNWAPPHTMLYTTPPQREWVGLTDEQKQDLVMDWFEGDWEVKKALWLLGDYEAKLKERNT